MVVALGPGRFYGSSLPRPRIYTDVKLNEERIDPPLPVSAPFLSWATEAHWSMGGLSLKRHRLQGRIEGSIKKLRSEKERFIKNKNKNKNKNSSSSNNDKNHKKVVLTPPSTTTDSPHPPPTKLLSPDSSSSPEEQREEPTLPEVRRRTRVRKLGDEFDREAAAMRGEISKPKAAESDLASKRSLSRSKKKRVGEDSPSSDAPMVTTPFVPLRNRRSVPDIDDAHTRITTKRSKETPSRIINKKGKLDPAISSKMLAATARIRRSGKESPRVTRSSPRLTV